MGHPKKPFALFFFSVLFYSGSIKVVVKSDPDYSVLVYKGCSQQPLSDPTGTYSQSLSSVLGSLVSQSTKTKFFKTSAGSSGASVSGLFQCRGDLSNPDCYDCASRLPLLIDKLCAGTPSAVRIQLRGCYMSYEVAGFAQVSGLALLYKTCGTITPGGGAFEAGRDAAFSSMESGVSGGGGFYATSYQSVYAVAQCEGDLGTGDCGQCVKSAVQTAQAECGNSVSAQVYLQKCFITYNYYPNGLPKSPSSPSSISSSFSGQHTGRTVAIILGGAAALGFVVICMLFVRNLVKRKDDF